MIAPKNQRRKSAGKSRPPALPAGVKVVPAPKSAARRKLLSGPDIGAAGWSPRNPRRMRYAARPSFIVQHLAFPPALLWPKALAEQAQAVRSALAARPKPATADTGELCKQFKAARGEQVAELLASLAALVQARPVGGRRFVA